MKKIKKIYLDMDGVLCNFDERYQELFKRNSVGEDLITSRDKKEFSDNWKAFVSTAQFEKLKWFEGAEKLIAFVDTLNLPIEILSSSGGILYHSEVREQKKNWLIRNGLYYPINIVPGRRVKKFFAMPNHILIDDTFDVIEEFNAANGIGILHRSADETIEILREHISNAKD